MFLGKLCKTNLFKANIKGKADSVTANNLTQSHLGGNDPKGSRTFNEKHKFQANRNGVYNNGGQWQKPRDSAEANVTKHSAENCGKKRCGAANQNVDKHHGAGVKEVAYNATNGKPRNRRREEGGQNTHGFGYAELNGAVSQVKEGAENC
jgi:hypothetical protein